MPMLGTDPFTVDNRTYIRKSLSVPRGMQAFWTSRDGGMALAVDYITVSRPELVARGCDTIVLNPIDYEAVKKSVMETPARDRAREARKRGHGDLLNFDAAKHFRESLAQQVERSEKQ